MGLFKKKEPVQVSVPRDDLSLDEIIENLSDPRRHDMYPSSDDIQSLLVEMGSSFEIMNRIPNERPGTNLFRVQALLVALLLKKMK